MLALPFLPCWYFCFLFSLSCFRFRFRPISLSFSRSLSLSPPQSLTRSFHVIITLSFSFILMNSVVNSNLCTQTKHAILIVNFKWIAPCFLFQFSCIFFYSINKIYFKISNHIHYTMEAWNKINTINWVSRKIIINRVKHQTVVSVYN